MFSIGDTRYRIPLDVGLVVLSAVAVDALVTRGHLLPKTGAHAPHADATSTADAAPVSAPSGR
jgi:hypothetical protein